MEPIKLKHKHINTLERGCLYKIKDMIDMLPISLQEDIISMSSDGIKQNIKKEIISDVSNDLLFFVPLLMKDILYKRTNQICFNVAQNENIPEGLKDIFQKLAEECADVASELIREKESFSAFERNSSSSFDSDYGSLSDSDMSRAEYFSDDE